MQKTRLIRRDIPLDREQTLRFKFTVGFKVPVRDMLDDTGEPAMTLEQIEDWLGSGDEDVLRAIKDLYSPDLVEFDVTLEPPAASEHPPSDPFTEVRFEYGWEREQREAGLAGQWSTREWLEGLPPRDEASEDDDHPTAEEVMRRDG